MIDGAHCSRATGRANCAAMYALDCDQAVFNGVARQFRYTAEVELAHKIGTMLLNGFYA